MAFSLQGWKSATAKKDFLRPTNFEMRFFNAPFIDSQEMSIRTESVTVPGIAFLSADNYRPYGNSLNLDIPYSMNTTEMTCTHLVDAKGDVYRKLIEWANFISNIDGFNTTGRRFSASYFNEYVCKSAVLSLFESDDQKISKAILISNIYPKSIDQMQMSWASSDEIVRLSVTYFYSNYSVVF